MQHSLFMKKAAGGFCARCALWVHNKMAFEFDCYFSGDDGEPFPSGRCVMCDRWLCSDCWGTHPCQEAPPDAQGVQRVEGIPERGEGEGSSSLAVECASFLSEADFDSDQSDSEGGASSFHAHMASMLVVEMGAKQLAETIWYSASARHASYETLRKEAEDDELVRRSGSIPGDLRDEMEEVSV